MAIFELRHYKIQPGKMDQWLEFMEDEIIPFAISKGAVLNGSFRAVEDETSYIWLRRFESQQEKERIYQAIYESDQWKSYFSPKIGELIDRSQTEIKELTPTSRSPLQ